MDGLYWTSVLKRMIWGYPLVICYIAIEHDP